MSRSTTTPRNPDEPHENHGISAVSIDDLEEKSTDAKSDLESIQSLSTDAIEVVPEDLERDIEQAQPSRASSTYTRNPVIVPRAERRGLFTRLTVVAEIEDPYQYSNRTKWFITFIVAFAGMAAPMGSAILMPALKNIKLDFDVTPTIANMSVALYMASMSVCPLWWSLFSELYGRRTIYLISFGLAILSNTAAALSTSMTMLIIMRVLVGASSASVQVVGAGTIADLFEPKERGKAMSRFYFGPLGGPGLGPIIGGVLTQRWGWRSTQWFLVIYCGILFITLIVFLPETRARKRSTPPLQSVDNKGRNGTALSRVPTRQSIQIKTKRVAIVFKRCFIDPLAVLLYLRYPAVMTTVSVASITFGCLYVLNISISETFAKAKPEGYGFSDSIVGLLYIPSSVGYLLASWKGGNWADYIMHREARAANRYDENGKLKLQPEDRMRENAWLGSVLLVGGLVCYGWTVEKGIHVAVPMIANFFFGVGSMLIFGVATTMLTEFLPNRSSTGVAINNFVRNVFSTVGGIVAHPIIDGIGNGILFTILGGVCWINAFYVIWAMKKYGPKWRIVMDAKLKS